MENNVLGIGGLSDCNWTGTHIHLVHKQALNHLAKETDYNTKISDIRKNFLLPLIIINLWVKHLIQN